MSVRLKGAPRAINILPASLSIPSLRETVSVTVPGHKHIPPTGTVRRGVSSSRFRNKKAYSATKRTTLNAILCCLSFFYSSNLASSRLSSPKEPDRWCGHHWVWSLSAFWLRIRKDLRGCLRILTCSPSQHLRNTVRLGGQQPTPVWPSTLAALIFATAKGKEKETMRVKSQSHTRLQKPIHAASLGYYRSPDAFSEKPSSWAQSLMMRTEVSACSLPSACVHAHTHTHSAPCSRRENAQSPDRSPELQISAPWTETPRINTDGERRDSRRESQSLSGGFSGMKTRTHTRAFTYTPNITRD